MCITLYIRVEWFWKKIATHSILCQKVVGPPILKFHVSMLPLSLVEGPQKMLTVTLISAKKISSNNSFHACDVRTYSLIFLKLKVKKNSKKYLFWPCTDQKQFAHFRKIKSNIKQTANIFVCVNCSLVYKKGVCKFSNKKIYF